jgi:enolase
MIKHMPKITNIKAREILDSRGYPTIETTVWLTKNVKGTASVPSSASAGRYEAKELRDGDSHRYQGRGVLKAVGKIKDIIAPALIGQAADNQVAIDRLLIKLDGTSDKSNLGANTILSVSLAICRAMANSQNEELYVYLKEAFQLEEPTIPVPLFNIFNGGKHADTNLDFQEFLIIPTRQTAAEMVRAGAEIFHELGFILKESGYDTDTGSEGGYAPDLDSSIEAIELIIAAAIRAGYQPGRDVRLGIDIGSSALYDRVAKKYIFPLDEAYFSGSTLIGLYEEWLKKYPIAYLEDGLAEDEWAAWQDLTATLGNQIMIAGDNLFATNEARLRQGLKEQAANTIIIKPGQIGTLTESLDCLKLAKRHNYQVVVSHRNGETTDDFIVDLAVATGADYLKAGSLSRGERLAKYNRLMEIAASLNL